MILVTGGAGFIGSTLVDALLARGDEVVTVDNFNDRYDIALKTANVSAQVQNPRFRIYNGDIRDRLFLERVFSENKIRTVVHLAALAGVRPSFDDPLEYISVNVGGTSTLLSVADRHEIDQFIFGSSSSVYGVNSKVPFSEDQAIQQPISPYAATKHAGELLCHVKHHESGIRMTCLRFFTVYGPRQRPEMAIRYFTEAVLAGRPIRIFGNGLSSRDYTFVDDIVFGILRAIEARLEFEVLNLGGSKPISLADLLTLIEQATGKTAIREICPDQTGDVPQTFADLTKAWRKLSYVPVTGIEDGIRKFVDWTLKNKSS
jgi:UDP-glucuronate 4-epimerase